MDQTYRGSRIGDLVLARERKQGHLRGSSKRKYKGVYVKGTKEVSERPSRLSRTTCHLLISVYEILIAVHRSVVLIISPYPLSLRNTTA